MEIFGADITQWILIALMALAMKFGPDFVRKTLSCHRAVRWLAC